MLRNMAVVQSVLFLGALISGAVIQAANGGFSAQARMASGPGVVQDQPTGFLKVVVDPWAELYINGKYIATTPLARSIPLPVGKYFLQLKNPYYSDGEYEAVIRPNEIKAIEVKLKRRETSSASARNSQETRSGSTRP